MRMHHFWAQNDPKGAGMIGVSRGIEYPLLHEILYTVSET